MNAGQNNKYDKYYKGIRSCADLGCVVSYLIFGLVLCRPAVLKIDIELWLALIEIVHHLTYI